MTIDKNIQNIRQKEENKMLNYLEWYNTLPGDFSGKIRIDRQYAKSIKNELLNSTDAYPTKLVDILFINPLDYNKKYPGAGLYQSYNMIEYRILYMNQDKKKGWYDEDMGFAIGLELIFKEFVDKNIQWSKLIKY